MSYGVRAMIWADRVFIVWSLIVWGFVVLTDQGHSDKAFAVGLFFTVAPWLLMRGLDFIATGTVRRRS